MVYDQFSDTSFKPVINLITQNPEFRKLTKHASLDIEENAQVPDTAFAWPERRLFRIDTRDNAVLSKLFIEKQASAVPTEVKTRCDNALRIYGLDPAKIKPRTVKTAALTRYVFPTERAVPVKDAVSFKEASTMLSQQLRRMDPKTRAYVAIRLVKTGTDLGAEPPAWALQYSGITMCNIPRLIENIEARAAATANPLFKYAFDRIAEALSAFGLSYYDDHSELTKLAEQLAQLDELAGLTSYYQRALPDPIVSVFNTTKVSEMLVTLAGVPVPIEKLLSVPTDVYAAIFGDDIVTEITTNGELDPDKIAAVLPTMPADLLRVFLKQLGTV